MQDDKMLAYIEHVIENMPTSWLSLTTHRLDIYDEKRAKSHFLEQFEILLNDNNLDPSALNNLPTAFDYIRLGHPLSCTLEWVIANLNNVKAENVISFSSKTIPILAILRKNLFADKNTQIAFTDELPTFFNVDVLKRIYGYNFELKKVDSAKEVSTFNGSTIYISQQDELNNLDLSPNIDFFIHVLPHLGSVLIVNSEQDGSYISESLQVRRRETIAMTPSDSFAALKLLTEKTSIDNNQSNPDSYQDDINKTLALDIIKEITGTTTNALLASCGLSIQYAIVMGLIHDALEKHKGKAIKIIVPPNCYGGTNGQARRVAACIDNVEVLDLPVDGGKDMVQSIDIILDRIANEDAVPYVIAEIPTNPRVEVPDLIKLKDVLSKTRKTKNGKIAIEPVFILDQTFCPNVKFIGEGAILSTISTISYVSGSKFPSGGKCTSGYCVANKKAEFLMEKIDLHLRLCDNVATHFQVEILSKQLPSMKQRIDAAYKNTREFVSFIHETLPTAKINFVSKELADKGFTPSVFSLDLPTKGNSDEEKESYKRALNYKLINLMIEKIPTESKFCVSYGQLKGCYWTIPATSTQGTTKEGDKDYIVRVSLSPNVDVELHKKVFLDFVESI